jgi:hypothetical protein
MVNVNRPGWFGPACFMRFLAQKQVLQPFVFNFGKKSFFRVKNIML